MRFKTISLIFAAVTEISGDGRKVKHHLRLEDQCFTECVANNLRGKFFALSGEDPRVDDLSLKFVGAAKSQLVQFAGTDYKCCEGVLEVAGSAELMRLGWECGF